MKMKYKIVSASILILFLLSSISAYSLYEFYYSPSCPHCKQVIPFINQMVLKYPRVTWKSHDVTQGSYFVDSVPTLIIDKIITLSGSKEIPQYAECYLQEKSTLDCPTKSASECTTDWFKR